MMSTVIPGPPSDRSFHSTGSHRGQEDPERDGGRVGSMSPQTMVSCNNISISSGLLRVVSRHTGRDTEPGHEIVDHRPDGGLPLQWRPESHDAAKERDAGDEDDIQPVDVLVPVGLGQGRLGDVRLRDIISRPSTSCSLSSHAGRCLRGKPRRTGHCVYVCPGC